MTLVPVVTLHFDGFLRHGQGCTSRRPVEFWVGRGTGDEGSSISNFENPYGSSSNNVITSLVSFLLVVQN
jgi:hypothetical protein